MGEAVADDEQCSMRQVTGVGFCFEGHSSPQEFTHCERKLGRGKSNSNSLWVQQKLQRCACLREEVYNSDCLIFKSKPNSQEATQPVVLTTQISSGLTQKLARRRGSPDGYGLDGRFG